MGWTCFSVSSVLADCRELQIDQELKWNCVENSKKCPLQPLPLLPFLVWLNTGKRHLARKGLKDCLYQLSGWFCMAALGWWSDSLVNSNTKQDFSMLTSYNLTNLSFSLPRLSSNRSVVPLGVRGCSWGLQLFPLTKNSLTSTRQKAFAKMTGWWLDPWLHKSAC